jgi:MoaA/NifB/PqqE/SkfB family radical SAM enzyme
MRTSVASNGMLLDELTIEKLKGAIDILAISLDGKPDFHNHMRGNKQAFQIMTKRLEGIRQSDIPFGFIFTINHQNFRHLDWIANFALEQRASLLQIHPLEALGRAKKDLAKIIPTASISAYAYLEAIKLHERLGDRLHVRIDLTHKQ